MTRKKSFCFSRCNLKVIVHFVWKTLKFSHRPRPLQAPSRLQLLQTQPSHFTQPIHLIHSHLTVKAKTKAKATVSFDPDSHQDPQISGKKEKVLGMGKGSHPNQTDFVQESLASFAEKRTTLNQNAGPKKKPKGKMPHKTSDRKENQ